MAFSLSNWFKGKPNNPAAGDAPAKETASTPSATPVLKSVTPAKPAVPAAPAVRKVVPNSVQPVSLRDPSARGPLPGGQVLPPTPQLWPPSTGRHTPVM